LPGLCTRAGIWRYIGCPKTIFIPGAAARDGCGFLCNTRQAKRRRARKGSEAARPDVLLPLRQIFIEIRIDHDAGISPRSDGCSCRAACALISPETHWTCAPNGVSLSQGPDRCRAPLKASPAPPCPKGRGNPPVVQDGGLALARRHGVDKTMTSTPKPERKPPGSEPSPGAVPNKTTRQQHCTNRM